MSDIVIAAERLSKSYLVGHQSAERESYIALRDVIAREARNFARKGLDFVRGRQIVQGDEVEEFWALRDVSFEVARGEVLGIIGRNGAGKSTVLKILSRITEPTRGRVTIRGRVASLLEIGTGFHPELTGRENIYLNGAILGMSQREIRKKFDEIVAFAEVEQFLDTPVKRFSSGMYVRLAFSVAAHLEPEILIVDEVLAVGDTAFQAKCLGKMAEVKSGGRTVLFVSHNLAAIQTLSDRAIMLDRGRTCCAGATETVVARYLSHGVPREGVTLTDRSDRLGNGRLRFTGVQFLDRDGKPVSEIISGDKLIIDATYVTDGSIDAARIILASSFWNQLGGPAVLFASDEMGVMFDHLATEGRLYIEIPRFLLRGGTYSLKLIASHLTTAPENLYDAIEGAATLRVLPGDFWKSGYSNRSGSYCVMDASMRMARIES
ncbi:MAG: ABC transporter ATP-binding protein [Verrucomicrobia bacterium]|nr:MAG: ABC transporter ATP-binding protein [Verrucomicrobiota bacterium]